MAHEQYYTVHDRRNPRLMLSLALVGERELTAPSHITARRGQFLLTHIGIVRRMCSMHWGFCTLVLFIVLLTYLFCFLYHVSHCFLNQAIGYMQNCSDIRCIIIMEVLILNTVLNRLTYGGKQAYTWLRMCSYYTYLASEWYCTLEFCQVVNLI